MQWHLMVNMLGRVAITKYAAFAPREGGRNGFFCWNTFSFESIIIKSLHNFSEALISFLMKVFTFLIKECIKPSGTLSDKTISRLCQAEPFKVAS